MLKPDPAAAAVQPHPGPARYRANCAGQPRRCTARRAHVSEVPVVAQAGQRSPAGRIDVAAGEPGRAQGNRQQVGEQGTDRSRLAVSCIQPGELGIGPEAAAGEVDLREQPVGDGAGLANRARAGNEQDRGGAEHLEGVPGYRTGRHRAPAVMTRRTLPGRC